MAVNAIPVDQRVIDIDSRRFASIEKALVELITNSDDSYARLEAAGVAVSGQILVQYERHRRGALLAVTDHAQGMSFAAACSILSYGGAHSPLAQGTGGGRGYFGRGLKQAIFGLGYGWLAGWKPSMMAGCRGSNCSAPRTAAISTMTVARIAR
ncbi:ATP-binding protein [Stutzerimonas kunmingensis]|uniref:ATP-binding protein n=1 Tax=Stutzerimonas kunmingensis TaxID=1211807 RepID=UPI00241E032F|nr:ATP-binding protein [Stutzerimonas kunmingensis]